MKSYKLVEFGQPVQEVEEEIPELEGTEVLVRVTHSGVCHSDLHIADGHYDLGGGQRLSLADRGITLPRAMGHEIQGVVEAGGPDAGDLPIGRTMLVYPWLGCGECEICEDDRENHCPVRARSLGVFLDGGYAEYCVVPHPKYLIDIEGLDPTVTAPYACSGLTVYSAIRKAQPIADNEWLVIMGAGGLGHMAITVAQALGIRNIVSCDIDDDKLGSARQTGASATVNTGDEDALAQLRRITGGGPRAVVDVVGAEATAALGIASLKKAGRHIVVGLYGGQIPVSLPTMPLRAISIMGSYVGNLGELHELIALVKEGKIKPMPISTRPLRQVQRTLDDLRDGKVIGRVVLTN